MTKAEALLVLILRRKMIKTLKQYLSLRGLLARRLRAKKREIEKLKIESTDIGWLLQGVSTISEAMDNLNRPRSEFKSPIARMFEAEQFSKRVIMYSKEAKNVLRQLNLNN